MYPSTVGGNTVADPIRSNNATGDIRTLRDAPQKQRPNGQRLTATDGTAPDVTRLSCIPGLTTCCPHRGTPTPTGHTSGCCLFRHRLHGQP